MFDQLFERPHALARQLSAPLVEERGQYLFHCKVQEFSRSSLRLTAHLYEECLNPKPAPQP